MLDQQISPKRSAQPSLVSVVIVNDQQGHFLIDCIESVLAQTYASIEIIVADNASTDHSWDVACDYAKQYPDKFFLLRSHKSNDPDTNLRSCLSHVSGKYFLIMDADGRLEPECIAKAVTPLEQHADACMTLMHRYVLDDQNHKITEPPFYRDSCKILPPQHAAMYLLAEINPAASQILYRTIHYVGTGGMEGASGHGNRLLGHRVLDFTLSCRYAIIYLNTPLVGQRQYAKLSHTAFEQGLEEVVASYFLNFEFCDIANHFGYTRVSQRLGSSVERLATLALTYAAESFLADNQAFAKRFYYLAAALSPDIASHAIFKVFSQYWRSCCSAETLCKSLHAYQAKLTKPALLDPPEDSLPLFAH